jgi:SAM-dependent methyltransferase|tara:strand:+ start:2049 stop:2666 length:618 start_codon:yes stop_codon:yes gene_type:complete
MKSNLIFFLTLFKLYKKKIFKIAIYEIYFLIKNFKSANFSRLKNINRKTVTIPCPYYFIHKISKFINKKQITNIVDLGSGFGRLTNYLSKTTKATVSGYEIDKEAFNFSIKNKTSNVTIENKDILNCDYKNLKAECFIINDPFHLNNFGLENLMKKIELDRVNLKKKTYFITININENKMHIFNNYKLLKLISAGQTRCIKFFSN